MSVLSAIFIPPFIYKFVYVVFLTDRFLIHGMQKTSYHVKIESNMVGGLNMLSGLIAGGIIMSLVFIGGTILYINKAYSKKWEENDSDSAK